MRQDRWRDHSCPGASASVPRDAKPTSQFQTCTFRGANAVPVTVLYGPLTFLVPNVCRPGANSLSLKPPLQVLECSCFARHAFDAPHTHVSWSEMWRKHKRDVLEPGPSWRTTPKCVRLDESSHALALVRPPFNLETLVGKDFHQIFKGCDPTQGC